MYNINFPVYLYTHNNQQGAVTHNRKCILRNNSWTYGGSRWKSTVFAAKEVEYD